MIEHNQLTKQLSKQVIKSHLLGLFLIVLTLTSFLPTFVQAKTVKYRVRGKTYTVLRSSVGYHKFGIASWYGPHFHGKRTASGERYNMYAMTAANKTLPLPTYVKVRNLSNNRSVVVKVNDRGPYHGNRLIDLSYAAAKKLGMLHRGTAHVEITSVRKS